ncbi:MAG: clostripain-related cysteine peptidase [Euryarchaeota archaeon]|nr:clostripain-related cysteine peptidase [Euryarchaeota archaeon]
MEIKNRVGIVVSIIIVTLLIASNICFVAQAFEIKNPLTSQSLGSDNSRDDLLISQTLIGTYGTLEDESLECYAQSFTTVDNQIDITQIALYFANPSTSGYCMAGISTTLTKDHSLWLDYESKSLNGLNGWTTFYNIDCSVNEYTTYYLMIKVTTSGKTVDIGAKRIGSQGPYTGGQMYQWYYTYGENFWLPYPEYDFAFQIWGNAELPPQLSYSPSTINFGTHEQGWTGSSTFQIWNSGGGTLTYSFTEYLNWISVSPTSGSSTGEYDTITVSVVNTDSMNGYYDGYIDISSNGGSGSIFVDITVQPAPNPILSYSPTEIHFGTHDQGWTGSSTFEIWNSGTGTLTYSISESISWITSINPSSGSSTGEHDTITINAGNTGSMSGYYSGTISISSNGGSGSVSVDITINPPQQDAEWTVMVYLDADNNLESFGIDDFLEMAEVGSTNDVNIVVQFDRIPGYDNRYDDWTTTKRYLVTQNMVPNNANDLMDIGEANMGDPQTLIDFGNWAISNYPANRYCLILWDHGGGWGKDDGNEVTKDVCWDDTNGGDALTMSELRSALATITSNGNNPIDLLGFDACLMQMIEVGYEVRSYCDFMTGSEETEPGAGWRYDSTLTILTGTPTLSPQALGAQFVSDYVNSGGDTLSTINLGLIDSLRSDVSDLGVALQNNNFKDEIGDAIENVESYSYIQYVDLYHFVQLLMQYINDNTIDNLAQSVMNEIENVVTSENHASDYANSHGLSIYVPPSGYDQDYEDLLFAQDSQWDEFLSWYSGNSGNNNPPVKPQPPSGQANGDVGVEYTYTAVTTDPDSDTISYIFSWGDDTTSQTQFVPSGSQASATHSWSETGDYEIKVKAVDEHGMESDWSDPLPISMPMELPGSQQGNNQQLLVKQIIQSNQFLHMVETVAKSTNN